MTLWIIYTDRTDKLSLSEISQSSYAPLASFSCGVLAGVLASVVTQPADVVKTHVQVSPDVFSRTSDVIRYIYKVTDALILPTYTSADSDWHLNKARSNTAHLIYRSSFPPQKKR